MLHHQPRSAPAIRVTPLWITDGEVEAIFSRTRCRYRQTNGFVKKEAFGVFVRRGRSNEGTLGYVLKNPIDGQNWLWVISKRNRKPFALCKVG